MEENNKKNNDKKYLILIVVSILALLIIFSLLLSGSLAQDNIEKEKITETINIIEEDTYKGDITSTSVNVGATLIIKG